MNIHPLPTLRCLIIDDETHAHKHLEEKIAKFPWLVLVGNAYNGIDGLAMIANIKPDLIFLDVEMDSITGLQMLKMLPESGLQVIINSSYHRYAVDAFDLNATDFLWKPTNQERFLQAMTKAMDIHLRRTGSKNHFDPSEQLSDVPKNTLDISTWTDSKTAQFGTSRLTLRIDKKLALIRYDDIIFFQSNNNYVTVYTDTDIYTVRGQLSEFEDHLPVNQFLRIQKSYIINVGYVQFVDGNELIMEKGYRTPISKNEKDYILPIILKS
ncbi:hypothetical protein DSL64_16040 [Dyadobacter luteus]|uniref:DNA-binding response regulator n=1 Tax=Dyadobacter luteus TaxID=2259619 RepID=A0A3D8Y9M7_9BACT|nr:LytTR family DNA-binding domain-containing protein [Dyadobacter luteus]REA60182.1 hypothetical protein DSL64_16040 [Dyadobacter luteus]